MISGRRNEIKALWLDDKISGYGAYVDRLRDLGFTVRVCKTNAEAKAFVRRNNYDLIIVDLKLTNETGIEFIQYLSDLHESRATIIVLSSFLDEIGFVNLLKDIDFNLFMLEKNLPASDSDDFIAFTEKLRSHVSGGAKKTPKQYFESSAAIGLRDPFEIPYSTYLSLPPNVKDDLCLRAYKVVQKTVEKAAKSGISWILFCGDSEKPFEIGDIGDDYPSEEDLEDAGLQNKRIPFLFEPPKSSDDGWCGADLPVSSYTTLNIVATVGAEQGRAFSKRDKHVFIVHFDTGSYYSYFSYDDWFTKTGDPHPGKRLVAAYRGQPELMFEKSIPIRIVDQSNPRSGTAAELQVYLVKNFYKSKLVAVCPFECQAAGRVELEIGKYNCLKRVGLIGRNIFIDNPSLALEITGNPPKTRA